jgi:hypothetical protein
MSDDFDINNIRAYFKFADQSKAMKIAKKYGITKKKFLEMKKNAGFTNWTKEKRKNKKLVQEYKECEECEEYKECEECKKCEEYKECEECEEYKECEECTIIKVDDDAMFYSKEIDEILSQIWIKLKN